MAHTTGRDRRLELAVRAEADELIGTLKKGGMRKFAMLDEIRARLTETQDPGEVHVLATAYGIVADTKASEL